MKRYLLFFGLLLVFGASEARHIIGGEITYECVGEQAGGRKYLVKMFIYRDCACTNCANFDEIAPISIYRCGVKQDCGDFTSLNAFDQVNVPISTRGAVDPPNFPCLELPPNICVEEAIYEFEVTLPISDESYHFVYQRCCRNVTISNIFNPEAAGATYTVAITPAAQEACNNSPVFDAFPPTVICVNQELEFDHAATDADGDQLVYEFCAPLLGGGRQGSTGFPGDANACEGVSPNPPCPPPFGTVRYIQPTYTFLNPLAGSPRVNINPNTGLITGTPTNLGQFVVGVCVKEFRNGVLLGEIRRDFQFNVANCQPTVVADIEKDSTIAGRQYLVNSCGENTVQFENISFREQFIKEWQWSFDISGRTQTFDEWSPSVTFPDTGRYEGVLILNPGTDCGDTANIFVNIFPRITADFEFEYDTCVAGPVSFTDLSETQADEIVAWNWSFGDGNGVFEQNPMHTYNRPLDFPVTLTVRDNNRCITGITKNVNYFPVPSLIVISPSDFLGCVPGDIFFDNLSTPIDETYDIKWDFGDGGTSGDISPTHTYTEVGTYDVSIEITSPIGCTTDTFFNELIETLPSPTAGFLITPEDLSNVKPTAEMIDQSKDAVSWYWDFSGLGTSAQQSPTFTFPDTGQQTVTQIVTHLSGCQDSLTKVIDILPLVRYFLPNAFTPNNDNSNDGYRGTGVLTGVTDFNFSIWNRWGEKIFETDDPKESWNGKKFNTGRDSPNGVYVCLVKFRGPRGKLFEYKSSATLVR
ncbi:MAG: PKD domain-containing protein [Bacteroidota bacterium]